MKKIYILTFAVLGATFGYSQTLMSENFDSYANGDMLSVVGASNGWGEWSGGSGTAESCTVQSAVSKSAPNSGNTSGSNDGLWTWTDVTSGIVVLNMSVYANAGGGAYIGLGDSGMTDQPHTINVYSDTMIIFVDYANQALAGATGLSGDQWYDLTLVMDIDNSTSEFFINGQSTGTTACGFGGAGVGFGGIDFWGTNYDVFAGTQAPGNLNFDDLSVSLTTADVSALSLDQVRVYPNPASDVLNFMIGSGAVNVSIVSLDGKVVSTTPVNGQEFSVNVSELTAGAYVYTVELESGIIVRNSFIKK